MKSTIFDASEFVVPNAKIMPVILLLDVSGSMNGERIFNLNEAVNDMLKAFQGTESNEIEIHVAIITFGANVNLHQALTSASDIHWEGMNASGATPLGTALRMAKAMIEDKHIISSRACRPTVILVSDGQPTDQWEHPMQAFISEGRSSKCDRMAMAIGAGANEEVLGRFIAGTENPLFYAENAPQMKDFFKFVTMSVTIRTKSQTPDVVPKAEAIEVKPNTIEHRSANMDSASRSPSDRETTHEQPSDEGYW